VATACLLGKRVWLLNVTGNGTVLGTPQALLTGEYGRLRGLVAAPDGSLWASTSNQEDAGDPAPTTTGSSGLVFSDGGAGAAPDRGLTRDRATALSRARRHVLRRRGWRRAAPSTVDPRRVRSPRSPLSARRRR
jgi:hypothetical protein